MVIYNKYDTQQNSYCFSTKLSEYLSFSRPVITTTIGEANNYFKDGVNAFIVEPHKPELIADKIVYACSHPKVVEKWIRKDINLRKKSSIVCIKLRE